MHLWFSVPGLSVHCHFAELFQVLSFVGHKKRFDTNNHDFETITNNFKTIVAMPETNVSTWWLGRRICSVHFSGNRKVSSLVLCPGLVVVFVLKFVKVLCCYCKAKLVALGNGDVNA